LQQNQIAHHHFAAVIVFVNATQPPKPNGVGVATPATVIFRSLRRMLTLRTPSLKSLYGRAISEPPGSRSHLLCELPLFRKATNKRAAAGACISSFLTSNTSMCFFFGWSNSFRYFVGAVSTNGFVVT